MRKTALSHVLRCTPQISAWDGLLIRTYHSTANTENAAQPQPDHNVPLRDTFGNENHKVTQGSWAVPGPLPLQQAPNNQGLWRSRFVPLCFDNPEACFRGRPTIELVRSIAVFSACGVNALVKNADTIFRYSQKYLGKTLTSFGVKATFFNHFCAGEDQNSIQPTIKKLHKAGIGAILDYAAESDVHKDEGAASLSDENFEVIVRTYDYESEKACDNNVNIFVRALEAAKTLPGQGFAAVKVTALGNPDLLMKLSETITEVTRLFANFDRDGNGFVTYDEFREVYDELFTDAADEGKMVELFHKLDIQQGSVIDYVSFVDKLELQDLPELVSKCRTDGPLKQATPTKEELQLLRAMLQRVRTLCTMAADSNLRIMIDAEHTYFQPAIDHIAKQMMREFNTSVPIVYNTYQCYLRDSRYRINADIESARRMGYKFGAKLVRGAYMVLERNKAAEEGYASPIFDSIEQTHMNYNRCTRMLIQEAASSGAEVMIATHNQYSVEVAVRSMHEFGLQPNESGVFFGQLLGMADHLSYTLGRHGYRPYKYVPFGPVEEVMPYLIRRAQENSDIMGGVGKEMDMLKAEVKRRLFGIE